jgi:hypothetical protein
VFTTGNVITSYNFTALFKFFLTYIHIVFSEFNGILSSSDRDALLLSSRSIVWLQNKRDAALERMRGPSARREDAHEYRVGRLKHERVSVPREETLHEWAIQLMKYHAGRKAVLEVILGIMFLHRLTELFCFCCLDQ